MRKKTGWPFFCKTRFTKNCFVLHLMAFSGVLGEHLPDAKKTIALRNSFVYKKNTRDTWQKLSPLRVLRGHKIDSLIPTKHYLGLDRNP